MTTTADPLTQRLDGPAPATEIVVDMVKRGLIVAPIGIAIGAAIWGSAGAASVAFGFALILFNFAIAAASLAWAGRISFALMGAAALFGYLVRLGLIFLAVWLVKDEPWIELVPLGLTIIITHLGLLFWELRYVSASLAYPGLKPAKSR
ncbi:MAG: ATP synthase subunit I [Acidimicrobiales bacterium]